jgi:LAS superfamily LD-carboxypeptidase LdcB
LSDDYQKISDIPVIDTSTQDKIGPTLDSQHTSLDNVLSLLIKDKYTRDTFKGISGFQGVILRVITEPRLFEYSPRTEILNPNGSSQTTTKYKVWVLGPLYSIFLQPETFDETPEDKLLIDALPDFSISKNIDANLSVGEIVWVSFSNTSNFKDPIIQYSFFSTLKNTASSTGNNGGTAISVTKPSTVFSNQNGAKQISLDKIPDTVTEEEGYERGKKIDEKIKLKQIYSYSSNERMRSDAAESFNKMAKDAADNGIKIIATSGFRSNQTQIGLYNARYFIKYPYDSKDPSKKPPSNSFINGYSAAAAYPGYSNHQNGTAVDIDVGVPTSTPPSQRYIKADTNKSYLWLKENASKYSFNNIEGKSVTEPWHWVYKAVSLNEQNAKDNPDE